MQLLPIRNSHVAIQGANWCSCLHLHFQILDKRAMPDQRYQNRYIDGHLQCSTYQWRQERETRQNKNLVFVGVYIQFVSARPLFQTLFRQGSTLGKSKWVDEFHCMKVVGWISLNARTYNGAIALLNVWHMDHVHLLIKIWGKISLFIGVTHVLRPKWNDELHQ